VPTNSVIASTGTTVALLVALLVLLGLAMIGVAVWLVRSTRTDPVALGPLEMMGERRWRKGDPDARRANLDTVRPPGAPPPAPIVPVEAEPPPGTDPTPPEPIPIPEAAPPPEICEPSMQESAVSAHTSEDADAEVDAGRTE
jgi:outer membrane biosynthesis protein TonB